MTPKKNEDSAKLKSEWDKIRKLEMKIGKVSKNEADMRQKMYDHKLKMEGMLNKAAKMEEEKKMATHEYDVKNRRGLTSQASQSTSKAKPPV